MLVIYYKMKEAPAQLVFPHMQEYRMLNKLDKVKVSFCLLKEFQEWMGPIASISGDISPEPNAGSANYFGLEIPMTIDVTMAPGFIRFEIE